MRIVIVDLLCNSPPYCGAITAALCDAGAHAELASPDFYLEPGFFSRYPRSPWLVDRTLPHSRRAMSTKSLRTVQLYRNYRRLQRAVRGEAYDVVHVEWIPLQEKTTRFMSSMRSACERAGVPLVLTAHNVVPHDDPSANRMLIRRNLDLADLVIAHTHKVADDLREVIGTKSRIATIAHGPLYTDMELPDRQQAAARLQIPGAPVVLLQGTIMPYKGLDLLLEAWPLVRAIHPTARLAIVGRSRTEAIRAQLAGLSLADGFHVVDSWVSTEAMLDSYACCDVVVYPYKSISQSGALMTAVGLGKPVVVTPLPGFLEQISGLRSVRVARDVSAPAIAEALVAALEDRARLAGDALLDRRDIIASPSGWPAVARRTLEEYRLAGARAGS